MYYKNERYINTLTFTFFTCLYIITQNKTAICGMCIDIAGAALQAVMDFFQILVTSGNSEVDFHKLFAVTTLSMNTSINMFKFALLPNMAEIMQR